MSGAWVDTFWSAVLGVLRGDAVVTDATVHVEPSHRVGPLRDDWPIARRRECRLELSLAMSDEPMSADEAKRRIADILVAGGYPTLRPLTAGQVTQRLVQMVTPPPAPTQEDPGPPTPQSETDDASVRYSMMELD